MISWIQLAQEQSKTFELAIPLIIGETYTISMNSNEPFMIYVGDVFVGETVDGSLEFVATNTGDVMITSYGDISMEFEIKLELGSRTEWSPAPEDGYNLDLPNGAYHIQTNGGTSPIKYRVGTTGTENIETLSSLHIHPFLPMRLYDNRTNNNLIPVNETTHWENTSIGTETTNIQARVELDERPEDPLDFIASDPQITDLISEEWLPITNEIVNNGTTHSKPILRITRGDNSTADLTVNGTRFIYFFKGTAVGTQVEIDFNLRTAKEGDTLTTPNLMIGYAYPIVDVGKNKVINKGNHKLEIRRESRYL